MLPIGFIAAIIALLSWAFGEFFIQRSVRLVGSLAALFFIGLLGFLVLTPLVWFQIPSLFVSTPVRYVLTAAMVATILAAWCHFRALRVGKLSVIEPITSLELVVSVGIGLLFLHDRANPLQLGLVTTVFLGIVLTIFRRERLSWWPRLFRQSRLERGVWLAIGGAFFIALVNVFTGLSSQQSSPLLTIWFIQTGIMSVSLFLLLVHRQVGAAFTLGRRHWPPVLAQSILDNTAWIAFATAVTVLPITITVGITESYIALAALLGIWWNRERLLPRQLVGVCLALASALVLAIVSS